MYGVDYNDTFAKFISICCILALVAVEDMEIHQWMSRSHSSMEILKKIFTWDNFKDSHTRKQTLIEKPHFAIDFR
jgi:hypothetical protein